MRRFFGYGSWDAKLWFVGMEEGGGESMDEIERRLKSWDRRDDLADLAQYQAAIGEMRWCSNRATIQRTWGKLIHIALTAKGQPADTESVRRYQRDRFGRHGGDEAVIELLPLPSPSTSEWLYQSSGIPTLASRKRYQDSIQPMRISAIRERIAKHRPEAVIFYGIGYKAQWEAIARMKFVSVPGSRFATSAGGGTAFVLSPHPVAKGASNSAFDAIGLWLRERT